MENALFLPSLLPFLLPIFGSGCKQYPFHCPMHCTRKRRENRKKIVVYFFLGKSAWAGVFHSTSQRSPPLPPPEKSGRNPNCATFPLPPIPRFRRWGRRKDQTAGCVRIHKGKVGRYTPHRTERGRKRKETWKGSYFGRRATLKGDRGKGSSNQDRHVCTLHEREMEKD